MSILYLPAPLVKYTIFLASCLIRDKHMNFYTLPHQEVRYMVYLPKRAGKYKILTPSEENTFPSGEAARESIFSRGVSIYTYPTAWGGIVFLYSPTRRKKSMFSRKRSIGKRFDGKLSTRESIIHLKSILSRVVYTTRESITHLKSILSWVPYTTREKYQNTLPGDPLRDYIRIRVLYNISC